MVFIFLMKGEKLTAGTTWHSAAMLNTLRFNIIEVGFLFFGNYQSGNVYFWIIFRWDFYFLDIIEMGTIVFISLRWDLFLDIYKLHFVSTMWEPYFYFSQSPMMYLWNLRSYSINGGNFLAFAFFCTSNAINVSF